MDSLLEKDITYGDLDHALLALGFQQTIYSTHRLYEKEDHGAVIMLPRNIQMGVAARAVHLLTARHTISGMGIASEAESEELFAQAHQTKAYPSPTTITADVSARHRSRSAKPRTHAAAPATEAH